MASSGLINDGSRHSSTDILGGFSGICRARAGCLEQGWNAVGLKKCSLPPILFENRTSTRYMVDIRTDRMDPNEQRSGLLRG